MRVCVQCGKFGKRVDTCDKRPLCRIADKGIIIVPPSDYLDGRATGEDLIEMPPTDPAATIPGDARYADVVLESSGALPRSINMLDMSPPREVVKDPFDDAMAIITAGRDAGSIPPPLRGESPAPSNADNDRAFYAAIDALSGRTAPVVTSPDGNPKTAVGITKPSLHSIPPVALLYLGQAMADGNRKYGLVNWRHDPITFSTYWDAAMRHMLALWDGEDADPATGIKHMAYIMANFAILLDAQEQGTLTDDRSTIAGKTAETIARMTRKPEKGV